MMDGCETLLAEVSARIKPYPPRRPLLDCNVFQMLGVGWDEVKLCRFLAGLLDPEGDHCCGTLFLASFLQAVLPECPMSNTLLAHTTVTTEFLLENGRRIDIVLQNVRYFIPIEVKIGAEDRDGQCYDYCQYAKNAPLLYLTRFGDAPSGNSLREKSGPHHLLPERVRCISWARDISGWLTGLLPSLDGGVKVLAGQYLDTIHKFADERGQRRMEQSVQAVLASPELFQAGLEVERSMKTAKVTLMRLMFDCFREEMKPLAEKYGLELETNAVYYSYEHPDHDAYYSSNASTYPGLNYVIKRAVYQRDSLQMWFRIEVDHNLFAGIALFDAEAEAKYGYSGCQVDDITPELVEESAQYLRREVIAPEDWWLTYCYPNGKHREGDYPDVPNFKTMNPCAVSLTDPEKRREYVQKALRVFEAQLLQHLLKGEETDAP